MVYLDLLPDDKCTAVPAGYLIKQQQYVQSMQQPFVWYNIHTAAVHICRQNTEPVAVPPHHCLHPPHPTRNSAECIWFTRGTLSRCVEAHLCLWRVRSSISHPERQIPICSRGPFISRSWWRVITSFGVSPAHKTQHTTHTAEARMSHIYYTEYGSRFVCCLLVLYIRTYYISNCCSGMYVHLYTAVTKFSVLLYTYCCVQQLFFQR